MVTRRERVLLTYDDYAQLPADGKRYQLIEGELFVTPSPTWFHQTAVTNLVLTLGIHVEDHQLGKVCVAPMDVWLSEHTTVQPDILFISTARLQIIEGPYVRGAPDLVVEVLSPGTAHLDRGDKMAIYARHGVPHYWIYDPDQRTAEAYDLVDGAYRLALRAVGDSPFSAAPFLDLIIPLARIWS